MFIFHIDAYQETDIIYSWGSTMKSDFKNLQDSGFDIPSFTLVGVELSEGRSQYSIGNVPLAQSLY